MSKKSAITTILLALLAGGAVLWLTPGDVPEAVAERAMNVLTQLSGIAIALAAFLAALPQADVVHEGRRQRMGVVSLVLALAGVIGSAFAVIAPLNQRMEHIAISVLAYCLVVFTGVLVSLLSHQRA
jgi:hypothetical protein